MNRRTPLRTATTLCLVAILCACDDNQGTGVTHRIAGKLSDESGKPLSNVKVSVFGYPHKSNETVSKVTDIAGPADQYSIEVPEGTYDAPRANVTATYHGRRYVLPLAAADNTRDWGGQRESASGLTRDFVWRLSGPKPTVLGENKEAAGFWGVGLNIEKGADFGDFGVVEVTLTPDGPLIDGSRGKPLTFKRTIPWERHEDHLLADIPVGRYVATATFTPRGSDKAKSLRLVLTSGNPAKLDENSAEVTARSVALEFEQAPAKPDAAPGEEPKFYQPTLMLFPDKERRGPF